MSHIEKTVFISYLDLGGGIRGGDQTKVEGFVRELEKRGKGSWWPW